MTQRAAAYMMSSRTYKVKRLPLLALTVIKPMLKPVPCGFEVSFTVTVAASRLSAVPNVMHLRNNCCTTPGKAVR